MNNFLKNWMSTITLKRLMAVFTDLDECQRGDHTCDQNAICANTDGGFNCECRPGYQGDGHRCHSNNSFVSDASRIVFLSSRLKYAFGC